MSSEAELGELGELGELVIIPHCIVCDARETLRTPLRRQPDGAYICEPCEQSGQSQKLASASSRRSDISMPLATRTTPPPEASRPPAPPNSHYAILRLPLDATGDEIERAYRALQAYWMPRRAGTRRAEAEEALEQGFAAYDLLRDPERRRRYDKQLSEHQTSARQPDALGEAVVVPLEAWPGRRITSLRDLLAACETSAADWVIGESSLRSGELLSWLTYSLWDTDAARTVEQTMQRADLSLTRKLNTALYALVPDRPYRFFPQPGAFAPVTPATSAGDVPALIAYADAHWDATVAHLYDGELIVWLESRKARGVYGDRTYEARAFYESHCQVFAGSPRAGAGLEMLLEFLDPRLEMPRIEVTFDEQHGGYQMLKWDGEIGHKPITMTIKNVTRGYFSGVVTLRTPTAKETAPERWLDTEWLPVAKPKPSTSSSSSRYATPAPTWLSTPRVVPCDLKGTTSTSMTFYAGQFDALSRGKTYTRTVALERYEGGPNQLSLVETFPIRLRLMRFLAGYRLALWLRGLRGGIPGALLDGGVAFLLGWLIVLLGTAFAPQTQWGFFPPAQDFQGDTLTFSLAIDAVLTVVTRAFYCATVVFGAQLPALLAAGFAFFGLFIGR
ncbi:MAG: J domain-containing protein, partial [Ktedonobacterales bacterium]